MNLLKQFSKAGNSVKGFFQDAFNKRPISNENYQGSNLQKNIVGTTNALNTASNAIENHSIFGIPARYVKGRGDVQRELATGSAEDLKQGKILSGGAKAVGTVLSMTEPGAIGLGLVSGLGALTAEPGDRARNAGRNSIYASIGQGVAQATNPVISTGLSKVAPGAGTVASKTIPAVANVAQGIGQDMASGQPTTPFSVGIDAVTGLVGGKGSFDDTAIKAGLVDEASDLAREARKYKSAEEFIESQRDFRDAHRAPGFDDTPVKQRMESGGDYNLTEVVKGQHNQPSDYFDPRLGPRYYMYDDQAGMESLTAINNVKRGAKTVTAYRVVPKDVKLDKLIDGDWISFSKEYALDHGRHRFDDGTWKIIKQEVPAKDVWWDGNDIREWGYDTGKTKTLSRSELTDIYNQAKGTGTDLLSEARKYKSSEIGDSVKYDGDTYKIVSQKGIVGDKWLIENEYGRQKVIPKSEVIKTKAPKQVLNTLNPTGGVLVDYDPKTRATMPLGENMTTFDKTSGRSPDELVTIYRGTIPSQKKIVPGDFITTSPELARTYGPNVISQKVPAKDILDDITEPLGDEYLYRPGAFDEILNKAKVADIKLDPKISQLPKTPTEEQKIKFTKYAPEVVDKIKLPEKVYRGSKENGKTAGTASLGKGLYTSSSKLESKKYGNVIELGKESIPKNPLVFKSQQEFKGWLLRTSDELGYKTLGDFEKALNGDIANYIRSIGNYDGVAVGISDGYNFVKFPKSKQKTNPLIEPFSKDTSKQSVTTNIQGRYAKESPKVGDGRRNVSSEIVKRALETKGPAQLKRIKADFPFLKDIENLTRKQQEKVLKALKKTRYN